MNKILKSTAETVKQIAKANAKLRAENKDFVVEALVNSRKVAYYDEVNKHCTYTMSEVCELIPGKPFGRNRLMDELRKSGDLNKDNLPTERHRERRFLRVHLVRHRDYDPLEGDGYDREKMASSSTLVTEEGVDWIIRSFVKITPPVIRSRKRPKGYEG